MKKTIATALSVILLIFSCTSLFACSSSAIIDEIKPTDTDSKAVGTVAGKYEILYDELRFITLNYRDEMENTYGDGIWDNPESAEKHRSELESLVKAALTVNASALITAENYGIALDDKDVEEFALMQLQSLASELSGQLIGDSEVDNYSPSNKEVNEAYQKYLEECYLSDRYNRYVMKIDGCIEKLNQKLVTDGTLLLDDDAVKNYVNENFVRTFQVFVPYSEENARETAELVAWILDTDFSSSENRDELANRIGINDTKPAELTVSEFENRINRLNSFKNRIVAAENIYEKMIVMVGSVYNKDTSHPQSGYYFSYGEYEKPYETAAYALEIGETSEVITTTNGYYVIQRLALDNDYIVSNLETLKNQYQSAYINKLIDETAGHLSFTFNAYGESLDLTKIK